MFAGVLTATTVLGGNLLATMATSAVERVQGTSP